MNDDIYYPARYSSQKNIEPYEDSCKLYNQINDINYNKIIRDNNQMYNNNNARNSTSSNHTLNNYKLQLFNKDKTIMNFTNQFEQQSKKMESINYVNSKANI